MVPERGTASPDSLAADGEADFGDGACSAPFDVDKELQRCLFKILRQKDDGREISSYLLRNCGALLDLSSSESERLLLEDRIRATAYSVQGCGAWLLFGQHKRQGDLKLLQAHFCEHTHLCLFCQSRRCYRICNTYWRLIEPTPGIHLHVTLTIPNTPDLEAGIRILKDAFRKLWNRARMKGQGPFRNALGAVVSIEITLGRDGLWHPHIHAVVTLTEESKGYLSYKELRKEWCALTGGRQIRVERIYCRDDLKEVLKYTVKPEQAGEDGLNVCARVEVWRILSGKRVRMLLSYGCYNGAPDPEEEPFDVEDFRLFFYRWIQGAYARVNVAEWKSSRDRSADMVRSVGKREKTSRGLINRPEKLTREELEEARERFQKVCENG